MPGYPRFCLNERSASLLRKLRLESPDTPPAMGVLELTEPEVVRKICLVLRMRIGDSLILLDGKGTVCLADILSLSKTSVSVRLLKWLPVAGEPPFPVTACVSLLKGEKFDWLLQKLTEVGVTRIQPVETERTVVRLLSCDHSGKLKQKLERWQAIVKEATEQCERSFVPEIEEPVVLQELIRRVSIAGADVCRLVCLERTAACLNLSTLPEAVHAQLIHKQAGSFSFLVGPEGGFTEDEMKLARDGGWLPLSLGGRILRSETAGICIASCIVSILESRERN